MKKFWNFGHDEATGERVLRLEGPIDSETFWGDEITPKAFREELEADEGDVTVWINSPGGNVFAAADIYTMLRDHKGKVTVKISAIAASAASVVAMAGDEVLMSPVAMMMIHDPMTIAMGSAPDLEKALASLGQVKESIISAYQEKSGLSRKKLSQMMSDESWLYAQDAVKLGFADGILFDRKEQNDGKESEITDKIVTLYSERITSENSLRCAYDESGHSGARTDERATTRPDMVLTMDGRTMDGSMPYDILQKQLDFLR